MNKAVVLLSGGLDSITALKLAQEQGFDCYALSLDYGQRHNAELNAAKRLAECRQQLLLVKDKEEAAMLEKDVADLEKLLPAADSK